jgi:hypothetical protein
MIEPNIFGAGIDENLDLNTAEALGFLKVDPDAHVNVYIIPDEEEVLSFLKNKTLAVA